MVRGGTIAVVGGSIAGCGFASAAARAGADRVVVLERTRGRLADRGFGLCVQDERRAELLAAGTLPPGVAAHRLARRLWVVRDGDAWTGRMIWEQPFPFHSYHWGGLWRGLREATPEIVDHRQGRHVTGVTDLGDAGAEVRQADGSAERFDLVVGTDGYRSVVRDAVCPEARPHYAGYVSWRGYFPAERLAALRPPGHGSGRGTGRDGDGGWPGQDAVTVCYPGGSCVIYWIPGPDGPLVNWVLYAAPPAGPLRLDDPTSFPPGAVTGELASHLGELLERHFPPFWAAALRLTPPEQSFVQPIYDIETPRNAAGRLLLGGDAAAVARPHSTSGAAKALQDACAFGAAWRGGGSWAELVRRYQDARGPAGRELVALARRLGAAQVERTPAWSSMSPEELDAWWRGQLAGAAGIGGQAMAPVR